MFFRSISTLATAAAILFAHTSLSAVVLKRSQDDIGTSLDARSSVEVFSNGTEFREIEARKGGGIAGEAIELVGDIITGIQGGINADKEARSQFTQNLVSQMHQQHPDFNWVICHVKHTTKFDGQRGIDWDHRHQEFDIKIGGTVGYEIYNLKSGEFLRQGDGGYLNWAYYGKVITRDQDGKRVVFAKP